MAKAQLGDRWVHGAVGPRAFDCSGLVYYAFRKTGNLSKIGGRRMSGYGYYSYFRKRGLASRSNGKPGDLVIWGGGSHVGIYLGGGKAISTLTRGVRIHGVHAVTARFTAFLHTGMSGRVTPPVTAPARSGGTDTTSTAPSTAPLPKSTTRRTTASLNLRVRPGIRRHIIRVLRPGTRLTILRSREDAAGRLWYKVQLRSGRTGWVASWYTRA